MDAVRLEVFLSKKRGRTLVAEMQGSLLARLDTLWGELDETEKRGWAAFAGRHPVESRGRGSVYLAPFAAFVSANLRLVKRGGDVTRVAPDGVWAWYKDDRTED
jgi:hypothetical protein